MNITKPHFWENRYQNQTTGWDIGQPAPGFREFLAQENETLPRGKMAVLGCGRGYDAFPFAEAGFEVIGFDFAPSAIQEATQLAQTHNIPAHFQQADIFHLPKTHSHQFDYLLEHTCFCAIPPEKRPEYVQIAHSLLKPQGQFIGIFFTHSRPGGPPFGVTPSELQDDFQPHFAIKTLHPVTQSVSSRQGEEHFGWFIAQ
ncbi:methyltransferase domain-containing protein [Spirulina sp. CS-785/01]|uniref:methyltransferase domain-containing protein n=1 Tax=Spirulina sp. CS-785/01 TaxID=3021716 RepID=UPI002330E903|nr:methyltransferase domain-containing protein [Spirulina sp. CS-785/01]MDB9316026.1 methyltransferase domain-containing protein [Spirulina sp. CS-785/01]